MPVSPRRRVEAVHNNNQTGQHGVTPTMQPQTAVGKRFKELMEEEHQRERQAKKGEQLQAAFDAFVCRFARSKKGNLWRRVTIHKDGANFEELTLTVFGQNGCRLCVADKSGPHYGETTYDNEQDALLAIFWMLRAHYGSGVELV